MGRCRNRGSRVWRRKPLALEEVGPEGGGEGREYYDRVRGESHLENLGEPIRLSNRFTCDGGQGCGMKGISIPIEYLELIKELTAAECGRLGRRLTVSHFFDVAAISSDLSRSGRGAAAP